LIHYFLLELISNQKQLRKACGPQEGYFQKRCEIQGGGQEMGAIMHRQMAKISITFQVNLCCLLHISLGFGTSISP